MGSGGVSTWGSDSSWAAASGVGTELVAAADAIFVPFPRPQLCYRLNQTRSVSLELHRRKLAAIPEHLYPETILRSVLQLKSKLLCLQKTSVSSQHGWPITGKTDLFHKCIKLKA